MLRIVRFGSKAGVTIGGHHVREWPKADIGQSNDAILIKVLSKPKRPLA
jgi:hypothetical protein